MMKNEMIINKIYNSMYNIMISNVDVKYRKELLDGYIKYLKKNYSKVNIDNIEFEKSVNALIKLEMSKWNKVTQNGKLSLLVEDNVLNNIRKVSNDGYKFVRWKIANQQNSKMVLQNNYAEQCIKYLKDSLSYVKDFNKDVASMLVSEGILDFEYASGKSCNTSFRIGHIK